VRSGIALRNDSDAFSLNRLFPVAFWATGYQFERADDALQIKLRAFIAEELRAWEKAFPDELWAEFGRLLARFSEPV
jgi:hypothetical protein